MRIYLGAGFHKDSVEPMGNDLSLNLSLMAEIIAERVMDGSGAEMGVALEDIID